MVPLSGVEECWPPGLTLGGGGVCVRLCLFQGSRPDGARPPHSSAPGSGHGSQSSLPVCGGRGRLDAASTLSQMLSRRWDAQLVRPPAWGPHHPPPVCPLAPALQPCRPLMSLAIKRKKEAARPESSLSHWFGVFPGPSFTYSLYEACMCV